MLINNSTSYAPMGKEIPYKQIRLEVIAILDMVPGAFHQPEDIMNWINSNPYVRCVELKQEF